jgi:hypothetical protein
MTSSFRCALSASLLVLLCVPRQVRAQAAAPTQAPAPAAAAKKVWTNDNISAIQAPATGGGGAASSAPRANGRDLDSSSDGATFINPKLGQVAHPGETLHVDLEVVPGVAAGPVAIVSPIGDSNEIRQGPPYSFTFAIPSEEVRGGSGPLIGLQNLNAFGPKAGLPHDFDLATTTIDVEEPDLPVSLSVGGQFISNNGPGPRENFLAAGNVESIAIYAKFPNGHELDVTNSTNLEWSTSSPAVIRVADRGTVVGIGPGIASVIATYAVGGQQKQISVPFSVQLETSHGLVASPAVVDFGDVPVDTTSASRQVTISNNSSIELKIYKVDYDFSGPENCSNRTLAPGESCTLTVNLRVVRPGPSHWTILISANGYPSFLAVTIIGNGI